jgi:hypothetical protein
LDLKVAAGVCRHFLLHKACVLRLRALR